jgi:hypothetical protein
MGDVADETHQGGLDQEAPEEANRPPRVAGGDLGLGAHRVFLPGVRLLENVDVLSGPLGMELELKATEYRVGDFSLDILGSDLSDESAVIVENPDTPSYWLPWLR